MLAHWRAMDAENLDASFRLWLPASVAVLRQGQREAVRLSDVYLARFMTSELRRPVAPTGLSPEDYAGRTRDGRDLQPLLGLAIVSTKLALGQGRTMPEALNAGAARAVRASNTEVMSASRSSLSDAMQSDERIIGYERVVNSDNPCGACLGLADEGLRATDQDLEIHANCVPSGVLAAGPTTDAALVRWYEGDLVVIRTASGELLPVTPQHPVLTDRGWIPSHLIKEGEYVVRGRAFERMAVDHPDRYEVPTLIEEAWRARAMHGLLSMPLAPEDLHGDGSYGYVDVVATDGLLRDRLFTRGAQPAHHLSLGGRGIAEGAALDSGGRSCPLLVADDPASDGGVRGFRDSLALFLAHRGVAQLTRLRRTADGHAGFFEASSDHLTGYADAAGEFDLMFASEVARDDLGFRQRVAVRPRFDPTGPYGTREGRRIHASRGRRLLDRLAGDVELDRVVELRRVGWRGHVYNLQTAEGWFSANGIIISNCSCTAEPVVGNVEQGSSRPSGSEIFDGMDKAQQDALFAGRGGADKADLIRSGSATLADLVSRTESPAWGMTVYEKPLKQLNT
jgi:hypothetical protein